MVLRAGDITPAKPQRLIIFHESHRTLGFLQAGEAREEACRASRTAICEIMRQITHLETKHKNVCKHCDCQRRTKVLIVFWSNTYL